LRRLDADSPTASLEAWQDRLSELLGGVKAKRWIPETIDLWAYRYFNVGGLLGAAQAGISTIVAWNPKDEKTTPFCNWVHGRTLSVSEETATFDRYSRAVRRGDGAEARGLWPILNDARSGGAERFRNEFKRLGLPPYHFRCRTRPRLVVVTST